MLTTTRQKRVAIIIVLGALLMGSTAWLLSPKPIKVDPASVQFLYCKKCEMEFLFNKQKDDVKDPCPRCEGKRIPIKESIKKIGSIPNPYNKIFTYCFVEFILILGAIWFVARPTEEPEIDYIYMNCPHCNQKIRYVEKQIGKPGLCRRCKKAFEFPSLEVSQN